MFIQDYFHQLRKVDWYRIPDIVWCSIRYGASPNNYIEFNFNELNDKQRQSYVTNRLSRKIIKKFNKPEYTYIFENKVEFAKKFCDFFGREWLETKGLSYEAFSEFVSDKKQYIYKPIGNAQGQGIVVLSDSDDLKETYEYIKNNGDAILEEWIEQHSTISSIYEEAVNCLRLITINNGKNVSIITGGVTWGNGEKIANACYSGIVSPIELDSGTLTKPAADLLGNVYHSHPITKQNLVNIKLPYWKETIEMLKEAAIRVPQVGYVGWDIAITPTGPIIIEGNTTPGYKYYQIPVHMLNKLGNKRIYKECLNSTYNISI